MEHPLNEIGPGWGQTVDDLPRALVVATDADPEAGLPARPVAARNPAVGARKHFSCAFVYGPGAGCVMQTESLTEKRLALVLLARPDIVALETQVVFTWDAEDGSQRRHYFDFRATKTDGSRVAIMVKYDRKLSREEFRAQIADIAAHVTPDFADRVTLMTERHLDPVNLHNATLFNAVRRPDPQADAVMRDTVAQLVGTAKIGDLIAHAGLGGRGFRAIARLIGARELELQTPARIDYDTHVIRSAA